MKSYSSFALVLCLLVVGSQSFAEVELQTVIDAAAKLVEDSCKKQEKAPECVRLKVGLRNLQSNEAKVREVLKGLPGNCDQNSYARELAATLVGGLGSLEHNNNHLIDLIGCIEKKKPQWQKECHEHHQPHGEEGNQFSFTPSQSCQYPYEKSQTPLDISFGPDCKMIHLIFPGPKKEPGDARTGSSKGAHTSYIYGTWEDHCQLKFHNGYKEIENEVSRLEEEIKVTKDTLVKARLENNLHHWKKKLEEVDREIEILSRLKGQSFPGLPRVLHANRDRFAMESFQQELFDVRSLPFPTWLRLGHQINAGLTKLHEMGFIHSDIKPENIMLSNIDRPIDSKGAYVDPGAGYYPRKLCEEGQARPIRGTLEFFAPDQQEGVWADPKDCIKSEIYAQKDDVFSHAAMIFKLRYGDAPWHDNCEPGKSCCGKSSFNKKVCPQHEIWRDRLLTSKDEIDQLIGRSISIDPNQRPTMVEFSRIYKEAGDRLLAKSKIAPLPDFSKGAAPEAQNSKNLIATSSAVGSTSSVDNPKRILPRKQKARKKGDYAYLEGFSKDTDQSKVALTATTGTARPVPVGTFFTHTIRTPRIFGSYKTQVAITYKTPEGKPATEVFRNFRELEKRIQDLKETGVITDPLK